MRVVAIQFPQQHRPLLEQECVVAGCQIDWFDSAKQAFDQIQNACYDCVITALTMEDMDGMELINLSRTLFPDIKILAINNFDRGPTDFGKVACRIGADAAIKADAITNDLPAAFQSLVSTVGKETSC